MKPELPRIKEATDFDRNKFGVRNGYVKLVFKEDVKHACEFYLKYKDNPLLLVRDWDDDWDTGFEDVFEFIDNFSFWIGKNKKAWKRKKYNEWLFKLAFKDVLEG